MTLLLDTHVWIWHVEGDTTRIGRRTERLLVGAASLDTLRVSQLSAFEVSSLCAAGRVRLSLPVEQWITDALEPSAIRLTPLTKEIAIDAGGIGVVVVPDPLDRLLVATARQLGATFVTRDRRLLDYAEKTSSVRVHNAAR